MTESDTEMTVGMLREPVYELTVCMLDCRTGSGRDGEHMQGQVKVGHVHYVPRLRARGRA